MRPDRQGFAAALYHAANRLLGKADVAVASLIIVGLAAILAMASHVALHRLSSYIWGLDPNAYPLGAIMIDSALAAIITASPIVVYCMGLVRRLRETKRDLRKAVAAAEAANNAKSSFLANMSHEIRTPLNGVLGMADVLSQEDLLPRQADCVRTIRESGKTLMSILNDVLDLSKIEAGKLDVSPVDANLHHVFHSVHKLFLGQAEEKSLILTLHIADNVPKRMRFDTVRVRQCVSNFVSNAVKFTQAGSITVSVSAVVAINGHYLVSVDIADTGIGMSGDVVDRLFSEFAQADPTTSRRYGGTGLGLAISRKLARLMDGDVAVRSKVGAGTVFTFTFRAAPAQSAVAMSDEESLSPAPRSGETILEGARVLLVDDNRVNRKVVRMLLKPAKMEIVDAANGKEALDLLAVQHFDLVLLDVHMPVMDGVTAIKHIRDSKESWNTVPVIALTADAMSGVREKLLALGMTGYATKPVDQRALITEIMRVCSLAQELTRRVRVSGL